MIIMRTCKSCGARLKLNMVYCPKCGVPVRPRVKTEMGKKRFRFLKNWKFWAIAALFLLLIVRIFGGVRYYLSGDINLSAMSRQLADTDLELTESGLIVSADTVEETQTEADAPEETGEDAQLIAEADEEQTADLNTGTGTDTGDTDIEEGTDNPFAETPSETAAEGDTEITASEEDAPDTDLAGTPAHTTNIYQQSGGAEESTAADTQTAETQTAESPSGQRAETSTGTQTVSAPQSSQGTRTASADQTTTSSAAQVTQASQGTVAMETATVVDQVVSAESELAAYENYLAQNLNYIFDGNYTLTRVGSEYYANVWVNGAAAEIEAIRAGKIAASEWTVFKNSLSSRAASLYANGVSRGLSDVHLNLDFLNDSNTNLVLITYRDGVETFDAIR